MKNFLKIGTLVALIALGTSAMAAPTLILNAPETIRQGQTFNVVVPLLAPDQDEKIYTIRTDLQFPPTLLEVTNFAYGPNLIPLEQSDTMLTDNIGGRFIRTAGYPGGTPHSIMFGTVTFRAKSSGTAIIRLNNNSFALNDKGENILMNEQSIATINIRSSSTGGSAGTDGTNKSSGSAGGSSVKLPSQSALTGTTTPSLDDIATTSTSSPLLPQTASVGDSGGSNALWWVVGILALVAIASAGYAIVKRYP